MGKGGGGVFNSQYALEKLLTRDPNKACILLEWISHLSNDSNATLYYNSCNCSDCFTWYPSYCTI